VESLEAEKEAQGGTFADALSIERKRLRKLDTLDTKERWWGSERKKEFTYEGDEFVVQGCPSWHGCMKVPMGGTVEQAIAACGWKIPTLGEVWARLRAGKCGMLGRCFYYRDVERVLEEKRGAEKGKKFAFTSDCEMCQDSAPTR